ncbi:hypothetical protein yruck0001_27420 [Yersinia ruckeri ATCC 29473]|uniref:Uncharacterized protein n=1 Tax=Yersinia ruckeri TaxID=29486 RepID=A0A0A8VCF1_YERRU|nr:hypothetical protein yruck0001_27420 [Yersinia ruckeri ATCC 29473]CEK26033.1 hypothetical protein CSF007_1195 [Yersinia ruckeri]
MFFVCHDLIFYAYFMIMFSLLAGEFHAIYRGGQQNDRKVSGKS